MPFTGWSPVGIASLVTLAAGVVLLVAYAVQRGLVHRSLEGIDAVPDAGVREPAPAARPARRERMLGAIGALLLLAGLAMGVVAAVGSWSADQIEDTSGGLPADDCAQSWDGCPTTTIRP